MRSTQSELGTRDGSLIAIGPASAHWLINLATAATIGLLVTGIGEPEPLMYALWVVIAIGAFVFGVRQTILRLLVVTFLIAGTKVLAAITGRASEVPLLEVTEWPLMIAITLIVALLAARVKSMAGIYAALYRGASDRLITAQEDERARLARDLHDGVGQTLTATIFSLGVAEAALRERRESDPELARVSFHIERATGLAASALEDVRDVAEQLRPPRIAEMGLGAALRELAESAGMPVEIRFLPSVLPPQLLAPGREIEAYRIVQEAVGNAARHSGASRGWIDASVDGSFIHIEVGDDGTGFDPSAVRSGLGLTNMRERASVVGGSIEIASVPGDTRVLLAIPLPVASASVVEPASPQAAGANLG